MLFRITNCKLVLRLSELLDCLGCTVLWLFDDRANTNVLVEEIDTSVTLWIQHTIEVKHIIVYPVLLQIEILDGRDAKNFSSLLEFCWVNLDTLLGCCSGILGLLLGLSGQSGLKVSESTRLSFIKEISKFDSIAWTRLHLFNLNLNFASFLINFRLSRRRIYDLSLLHYRAELHMVHSRFCWIIKVCLDSSSEDKFEVEFLAFVCDIDDAVCSLLISTITNSCHICGIIIEASVWFLDD